MYKINNLPPVLDLGYQGESMVTAHQIDCSEWLETWPDGQIAATVVVPWSDVCPLPVIREGSVITISVTRSLTAKAGGGSINIRLLDGDVEKRSAVVKTQVRPSHPPVEGEMPTVVSDWVAQAQEELNRVRGLTFEVVDGDLIVRM